MDIEAAIDIAIKNIVKYGDTDVFCFNDIDSNLACSNIMKVRLIHR